MKPTVRRPTTNTRNPGKGVLRKAAGATAAALIAGFSLKAGANAPPVTSRIAHKAPVKSIEFVFTEQGAENSSQPNKHVLPLSGVQRGSELERAFRDIQNVANDPRSNFMRNLHISDKPVEQLFYKGDRIQFNRQILRTYKQYFTAKDPRSRRQILEMLERVDKEYSFTIDLINEEIKRKVEEIEKAKRQRLNEGDNKKK